jgi:hypothetical protein
VLLVLGVGLGVFLLQESGFVATRMLPLEQVVLLVRSSDLAFQPSDSPYLRAHGGDPLPSASAIAGALLFTVTVTLGGGLTGGMDLGYTILAVGVMLPLGLFRCAGNGGRVDTLSG